MPRYEPEVESAVPPSLKPQTRGAHLAIKDLSIGEGLHVLGFLAGVIIGEGTRGEDTNDAIALLTRAVNDGMQAGARKPRR